MTRAGGRPGNLKKPPGGAHGGPPAPQTRKANRLQDEVYREMFLLESKAPGAEMGLALALVRAMAATTHMADRAEIREWLANICPHCLSMIERALEEYSLCSQSKPR